MIIGHYINKGKEKLKVKESMAYSANNVEIILVNRGYLQIAKRMIRGYYE